MAVDFNFHLVAFLDILGFSDLVSSDANKNPDVENNIGKLIKALDECDEYIENNNVDYRQFSDSIVLSSEYASINVEPFLRTCAALQCALSKAGFLTRGGVAHGRHYSNSKMLYSHGLVQAYEIESKRAIFPRVVISKDLLALSGYDGDLISLDYDGEHYLDYISMLDSALMVEKCDAIVSQNKSNPSVLRKLAWLHSKLVCG